MRKRFPWTGLLAVLLLAAVLTPLLLTGLLPRRYGRALDLTSGRELEFEELLGIRIKAQVHASVLSRNYTRCLGPLPDEHHWLILWTASRPPPWLDSLFPPQPPPRPGLLASVVQELNQLVTDSTYGEQAADRLSRAARGAAIERTLTVLQLSEDPQLAFNFVRGIRRQLDDATDQLGPDDFLTAEQYLTYAARHAKEDSAI